jgi:hypothetical protein
MIAVVARVKFDRSPSTVVVLCGCGWREVTTTRPAADQAATAHLHAAHAHTPAERHANLMREVRARKRDP